MWLSWFNKLYSYPVAIILFLFLVNLNALFSTIHRFNRPEKVFVVSVMPCFDKKLEASRQDFYSDLYRTRDIDCVIVSRTIAYFLLVNVTKYELLLIFCCGFGLFRWSRNYAWREKDTIARSQPKFFGLVCNCFSLFINRHYFLHMFIIIKFSQATVQTQIIANAYIFMKYNKPHCPFS